MSAYRSKYLRDKERQHEEISTAPSSKDATSSATGDVKNGKLFC